MALFDPGKDIRVLRDPTVYLVGRQAIDSRELDRFLADHGVSWQTDTEVAAATQINFLSWINISGKNVYLLKDVVSSGVIENYLLTQLRQKKPANLKLVAHRLNLFVLLFEPRSKSF